MSVTKTLQTLLISRTPWTPFIRRKRWPTRMSALSLSSITDWQTNRILLRSTAGRQRRPGAGGRSHEGSSVFSLGEQQQELPWAAHDSRRKTPGVFPGQGFPAPSEASWGSKCIFGPVLPTELMQVTRGILNFLAITAIKKKKKKSKKKQVRLIWVLLFHPIDCKIFSLPQVINVRNVWTRISSLFFHTN